MKLTHFGAVCISVALVVSQTARAEAPPQSGDGAATPAEPRKEPDEAAKVAARAKYSAGVELVQKAQWSEALATFEEADRLYPNPQVSVSMGTCERALGRYLKARDTFVAALAENDKIHLLPESSVTEYRGFVDEINHIITRAHVTLSPSEANIAIDGRPLKPVAPTNGVATVAAGVLPPGKGAEAPGAKFDVLLDPGAHVIVVSRKGFSDAVINRTFAPGSTSDLELKLDLLPATLKITSPQDKALVRVDGRDVGPVPAEVSRPAGTYKVVVAKGGFVDYESTVSVKPGEELKLKAPLKPYKPSIATRWWFWTAAGVVVTGGVLATYFATRPAPTTPPYDGGSVNWVAKPTAFKF